MNDGATSSTRPIDSQTRAAGETRRVLLKLSGEALMGEAGYGLHPPTVASIAADIAEVAATGAQLAVVVGGGNIFRGLSGAAEGMDRSTADYMGMLATVMNALALQSAIVARAVDARVMSAIPMPTVCEPYARAAAVSHLDKNRVVLFAAGTGNPFFTTDTAATLRALETGCAAMYKGTQVDGVYDSDPKRNPRARRYRTVSFQTVLERQLRVMDATAIALARDNGLPVAVFSLKGEGAVAAAIRGDGAQTVASPEGPDQLDPPHDPDKEDPRV